jgi:hypothetical protein
LERVVSEEGISTDPDKIKTVQDPLDFEKTYFGVLLTILTM